VRVSEWIALVYFVYIAVAALALATAARARKQRASIATRLGHAAVAIACAALVRAGAAAPIAIRNWLPAAYILGGYYVTGWLFVAPAEHLEAWLMGWDRHLLHDPATRFAAWPRVVVSFLEIVYMSCFLMVPGGFALLAATGHASVADRYWTMVVAAEFGAFAPLSVFQTRPPWVLERKPMLTDPSLHEFASQVVRTVTIQVNTFPSGHAAGSLAVALAVLSVMPVAGTLLLALAVSIGVACFVCRYHYVVDVVAGALVAVVVWVLVTASGV
jgi:membrane-associated phospholipid phosphatase